MKQFADSTLARAFDADGVGQALRSALGVPVEIDKAQVADVRYRPGRPCWLLYRFKIRRDDQKARWQLFAARLPGVSSDISDPPLNLIERYRSSRDAWVEPPVVRLPEFDLVLYPFPLDEAMPTLVDALDPDAVRRQLTRAWTARRAKVRKVDVQLLGYTPWARAALEYEVVAESGGLPELRRLVGKLHAMKPAARRFADAWAVWRAARGRIGLAPPAGYLGSMGVTLQDHVRGVRLGGLVTARTFKAAVRHTSRMLATLHSLPLPLATRRTPADEAATVHRWAALLVRIRPDLIERIETLRDWIASELEARATVLGPVHADFHHTNVLVDGDSTTLIDFDEMAYGDPLVDVGRFLASLRIPALRAHGTIDGLAEAGDAFLETYLRKAPHDDARVRLFEAAALFIAAASAFRIQRPNWIEETDLLLTEADRVAATAKARTSLQAGITVPAASTPGGGDARPWIEDPIFMRASLDPSVREVYGVDLVACRSRIPGRKPNSNRVRFDLEGWRGNTKWRRTLDGVLGFERGGHALIRRVRALNEALAGSDRPPLLPTPVAYLKRLSLLVWDMPAGTPLAALLLTEPLQAATVMEEVARTLAALHRVPVDLESQVSVDQELVALRRAVDRGEGVPSAFLVKARTLSDAATRACMAAPATQGPSLRRVSPRDILWSGGRVALVQLDRMTLSQPLFDVGDLMARLMLMSLEKPNREHIPELADRFRAAYLTAADLDDDGALEGFEAGALLRLACIQARSSDRKEMAERLIEQADERLTTSERRWT
jgi:aminoglycoside phosphotransferase (APT) family kinase protein